MDEIIIPTVGVAGIKLGDEKETVLNVLGEPTNESSLSNNGLKFEYDNFDIYFDKSSNVTQIGLRKGYPGKTEDGVGVGMTKSELENLWGLGLSYNKEDEYWEFLSKPGILFEFEKDEKGEEVVSVIYIVN